MKSCQIHTSWKSGKDSKVSQSIRAGQQGPTGRCIQLRDGSGSGIGKNFGFGFGYGSGSGIGTAFFINRVLSGIENLDRVFFGYIPDKVFLLVSTKVLAALGRSTPVHPRDPIKQIK